MTTVGTGDAGNTREEGEAADQSKTLSAHAMDVINTTTSAMQQTSALVVDDLQKIFSFFIAKDSDETEQEPGGGKKGSAEEDSQPALPTVEGEGFRVLIREQLIAPGPPGVVLDFGKVEIGRPQTERVVVTNLEETPVVYSLNCSFTAMAGYRLMVDGNPLAGYSVKGVVDKSQSREFIIECEAVDTGCEADVAAISLTVGGHVHDITIRGCGVAPKQ